MIRETGETVKWRVHRFDVVAVSEEIEEPKQVLMAGSVEEVEKNLPGIIAQLVDPRHQHILIILRRGICRSCAESNKKLCEHLGKNIPSLNFTIDLDLSKMVKDGHDVTT
ncbi:MAG: hypothetical protein CEN87_733 [Parcubacteria group bacterium Licking1014_1]|nr:MAG: hypothetical protein CEN87_733 [Parcubacteria group bacterium Licking1014_1]